MCMIAAIAGESIAGCCTAMNKILRECIVLGRDEDRKKPCTSKLPYNRSASFLASRSVLVDLGGFSKRLC